jgi:hypothetical protein
MKKILFSLLGIMIFLFINGCSKNTEPQFRISNKHVEKVNVKIETASGHKFTINDVEPGTTTNYQTVSVGNITVTSVDQNESISFLTAKSSNYTIIISTGKPPSMRLDQ